jgi:hypothetical protein
MQRAALSALPTISSLSSVPTLSTISAIPAVCTGSVPGPRDSMSAGALPKPELK